jgi:hypothetical protein
MKILSAAYHIMSPKEACAKLLRPLGKSYPHLLSRIKKVTDLKALGCSLEGPALEILDAGAQGFFQKPFSLAILSEKMQEIMGG